MARIRSLKPESLQHRKVGRLSDRAFRLWIGMLTQADDYGRLVADTDQLRVLIFGYQPKITEGHIQAALEEIRTIGLCRLYSIGPVQYADFPSWDDHQRISHKTDSKLPEYCESGIFRKIPEDSGLARARGSDLIRSDRKGVVLSDDQFLTELKANPAYHGIDVDREMGKLDAWLLTPRGRGKQKTRQRVVEWLNRADRPMQGSTDPYAKFPGA